MKRPPVLVHGWRLFAHPLFLAQVQVLAQQVETLQRKDPEGYVNKNASKRLSAINKLAFDIITQDPTRPEYRQGHTLGGAHKHWFRAKDDQTKRAFESSDDAYRVFRKMLESGHPPDDWDQLLRESEVLKQR